MRILRGAFKLFFQLVAQRLMDVMLHSIGRRVHVIRRQAEMLDQIRFPQPVATDQTGRAPTAVVRHVKLSIK